MADYFAQVHGTLPDGRTWSTGRHITSNQDPNALLTTWANAWTSAWNVATTGLATLYPAGVTITQFTVATLNGQMKQQTKFPQDAALVGSATGDGLPASCSIVVDWRSVSVRRSGRGRQALPPPAESQTTNDNLNSTPAANVKAAINTVKSAINADGSTFFVFNRHPLIDGTPAYTKTVLTSVAVRNKIGSQRQRIKKAAVSYT